MKYRIDKTAEIFEILWAINKRANAANALADDLAKQWGASGCVRYSRNFGGRPDGFIFAEKKFGWVHVEDRDGNYYMPARKPANKELWKKIRDIPVVASSEIADALKFSATSFSSNGSFGFITCPGVQWKKGFILVDIPNGAKKYKPLPGMKEILDSEFIKLSKLK